MPEAVFVDVAIVVIARLSLRPLSDIVLPPFEMDRIKAFLSLGSNIDSMIPFQGKDLPSS